MSADIVSITIYGLNGKVLVGPGEAVSCSVTVGELKQRLTEGAFRGSPKQAVQLLFDCRELLDNSTLWDICTKGSEVALTAMICQSTGLELAKMASTAKTLKYQQEQSSEQWLQDLTSASPDRKQEQREADICEYKHAVEGLVEQLGERAVLECRIAARQGRSKSQFDLSMPLQFYELGAKMYFRFERNVRSDPVLRGWYFSLRPADVVDAPETMRLGNGDQPYFTNFMKDTIMPQLAQHLEEKGLQVTPDEHCIHYMTIYWSGHSDSSECGG
mmetsp:Transcript_58472/g.171018  ORF Transcript_58472/g.171018 Transcript_58472/m.171018 type:complete len:273 (-) Transcript_58472:134-952(-)